MSATHSTAVPGPDDEQTLFRGRAHAKILFRPALAQLVLIAAHVAMALYFPDSTGIEAIDEHAQLTVHSTIFVAELWYVVWPFLQWRCSLFEVTDRRIRQRWGVLHKHSREIHLDRVTQINEERQLSDRIFRCGTIVIHDAANASAIRFHDVPRSRHVRTTIDAARHSAHTAGMHRGHAQDTESSLPQAW